MSSGMKEAPQAQRWAEPRPDDAPTQPAAVAPEGMKPSAKYAVGKDDDPLSPTISGTLSDSYGKTITLGRKGRRRYLVGVGIMAFLGLALTIWAMFCQTTDWDKRAADGTATRLIGSAVKPINDETAASLHWIASWLVLQALVGLLGTSLFFITCARSDKVSKLQKLSGWYFCVFPPCNYAGAVFFNFLPSYAVNLFTGTTNCLGTMVQMMVLTMRCKQATEGIENVEHLTKYMRWALIGFGTELVVTLTTVVAVDVLEKTGAMTTDEECAPGTKCKLMWGKHGDIYLGYFVFLPAGIIWGVFWLAGSAILYHAMVALRPNPKIDHLLSESDKLAIKACHESARLEFLAIFFAVVTWLIAFPCYVLTAINSAYSPDPEYRLLSDWEVSILCMFQALDTIANDLLTMFMGGLGRSAKEARDSFLAAIRVALKSQNLSNAMGSMEQSKKEGDTMPWVDGFTFNVIDVDKFVNSKGPLPKHQTMMKQDGWLVQKVVTIDDISAGRTMKDTVAVSYSWETAEHPDPDGSQADAVRKFLRENTQFKWLWLDWSSLPQNDRSPEDKKQFMAGLKNANMMYLGASVAIVLTERYMNRFWTQLECFLSFQCVDEKCGLSPLPLGAADARTFCLFPTNVPEDKHESIKEELMSKWSHAGVFVALGQLAEPSTVVTNKKDKIQQLAKVMECQDTAKQSLRQSRAKRESKRNASQEETKPLVSAMD